MLFKGADLVNGKGDYFHNYDLLIDGDRIKRISQNIKEKPRQKIIHCAGKKILPGLINVHAHGVVLNSPLFSSGSTPLEDNQVRDNLMSHLSQGTTSIVNLDGFCHPKDIARTNQETPVKLFGATTHFDSAYSAARALDGSGLSEKHYNLSSKDIISRHGKNILVIGENGSGATMGGGVQDYLFIPKAIERETGTRITRWEANRLKRACLGKYLKPQYDEELIQDALTEIGVDLSAQRAYEIIIQTVMPPYTEALTALRDGAQLSEELNIPMIAHNATASMGVLEEIATELGSLLIAGHCNHRSFSRKEMRKQTEVLKGYGSLIDVCTFDALDIERTEDLESLFELINLGLVDFLSTDYGGGNHSSILGTISWGIKNGYVELPEAIKLCTYNPAKLLPEQNIGYIEEGNLADLVVIDSSDVSDVLGVYVSGQKVYSKAK
ncbi:MAG: 5'-deoxyadenosine deaminase [Candidatus Woesearchaeota archaeon]|nr:5'-deoxyadenosine deaminase [Candidatus Woesearchaeota archaeon]